MTSNELTLDLALEAFWAKVAELHPERETGDLPPTEAYDLENYARNAVDVWLEMNKPVFYVQRTKVQVIRVVDASTPEEAEEIGADYNDQEWAEDALDTSCEYLVVNKNGMIQG